MSGFYTSKDTKESIINSRFQDNEPKKLLCESSICFLTNQSQNLIQAICHLDLTETIKIITKPSYFNFNTRLNFKNNTYSFNFIIR